MKCAVHSDVDAVGYCRNCGKAMCSACVRPVRDVLYCEDCLAGIMGIPGASACGRHCAGAPRQDFCRLRIHLVRRAIRPSLSFSACFPDWARFTTASTTKR